MALCTVHTSDNSSRPLHVGDIVDDFEHSSHTMRLCHRIHNRLSQSVCGDCRSYSRCVTHLQCNTGMLQYHDTTLLRQYMTTECLYCCCVVPGHSEHMSDNIETSLQNVHILFRFLHNFYTSPLCHRTHSLRSVSTCAQVAQHVSALP